MGYAPLDCAQETVNAIHLGNSPMPHFESPFWLVKPCKSTRWYKLAKNCIRSRGKGGRRH